MPILIQAAYFIGTIRMRQIACSQNCSGMIIAGYTIGVASQSRLCMG